MTKTSLRGATRYVPRTRKFPRKPLFIVTGLVAAVITLIGLLPSFDVEAKRSDIELAIDQNQPDKEAVLKTLEDISAPKESAPKESAAEREARELAKQHAIKLAEEEQRLGKWQGLTVQSGDNLSTLFNTMGLSAKVVYDISKTPDFGHKLSDIRPGQHLEFRINSEGTLTQFRYVQSKFRTLLFENMEKGFKAQQVILEPEIRTAYAHGDIENSLFVASQKAGLPENLIMELTNIFGWDVDFAKDIHKGDSFNLIYEEKYLDNEKLGNGDILAATFVNRGKSYTAVRYTDSNGDSGYFTPEGKSMKKAFIRTPVDFTRISSSFNPDRLHPLFKTKRPHLGVDYAAPSGTPIKAAGEGRITFMGWQNGYGNVVFIQHPNNIVTVYAHQSRVNKKLKVGNRVRQGQVIGYVGQTGWATGSHLHFEFRVGGMHRDPVTVKLPNADPIPEKEKAHFTQHSSTILATLERHSGTMLARNPAD